MGVLKQILAQIEQLPISDRLLLVEKVIEMIREEAKSDSENELALAAQALLEDYKKDNELTIFTSLDSEEFYEES